MVVQAARASLVRGPVIRNASLRGGLEEGSATSARAAIHLGKTCCSTPGHELFKDKSTESVLTIRFRSKTCHHVL